MWLRHGVVRFASKRTTRTFAQMSLHDRYNKYNKRDAYLWLLPV